MGLLAREIGWPEALRIAYAGGERHKARTKVFHGKGDRYPSKYDPNVHGPIINVVTCCDHRARQFVEWLDLPPCFLTHQHAGTILGRPHENQMAWYNVVKLGAEIKQQMLTLVIGHSDCAAAEVGVAGGEVYGPALRDVVYHLTANYPEWPTLSVKEQANLVAKENAIYVAKQIDREIAALELGRDFRVVPAFLNLTDERVEFLDEDAIASVQNLAGSLMLQEFFPSALPQTSPEVSAAASAAH